MTPRPALLYTTKQIAAPTRTTHYPSSTQATLTASRNPGSAALSFAAEFQKFQQDNQIIPSTAAPVVRTTKPAPAPARANIDANSNPVYSTELVFDPASGQYKTALYQTLPESDGGITLNHRIQPYVHQPQPQLVNIRQLQQQSPLYRTAQPQAPRGGQAVYQQQQAELQFQNSQQLFAEQQRARVQQQRQHQAAAAAQAAAQAAQPQPQAVRPEPQQFYYIQPQALHPAAAQQPSLSSGQIDAFLRGHNIQFWMMWTKATRISKPDYNCLTWPDLF